MTFIPSYSIFTDEDLSLQNVVYLLIVHTHYFCDFTDLARVADSIHDLHCLRHPLDLRFRDQTNVIRKGICYVSN